MMKKRLIAFLLVLIMVLGMLPVSAFAVDGDATKYTYTLYYKYNDGTDSTWLTDVTDRPTAATTFTFNVNRAKLTRSGYDHIGWADKADAVTAKYTGGDPIVLTKDNPTKTIYAVWMPFFELRYDANGGTGAPASQTRTAAHPTVNRVTFTVPNQTPSKEGYTFKGWADSAAATTAQYQPGDTVDVKHENSPKTVYAVWEKNDSPVPDNPGGTKPDVANAQVKICVQCIEDSATHQPKNYGILPGAYVDGLLQVDGTYYYSITLNRAKYIEKFDQDSNKTHTDTEPNESIQFKWQWKNGKWELISEIAPVIKVKCDTTTKPSKPALNEGSPVLVQCVQAGAHTDSGKDLAKRYFALGGYANRYEEVKKEGSNVWKDEADNKWTYQLKLKRDEFVKAYNNLSLVTTHTDTNPGEETYVTWKYDGRQWNLVPVNGLRTVGAIIEVTCEPEAPTADELKKLEMAVQVKCVVDAAQQHTSAYGLLGEYDKDYFVGEPKKVGDDWLCDISYDPDPYVAEFNKAFPTPKHIQNDEKIVPVTLIWVGGSWQIKTQGRVLVTEVYTVTFNSYGGTPVPPAQEVEYGLTATEPAAPEKTGYTFDGWYLDGAEEPFSFDTTITSDITLKAKWKITPHNIYAYLRTGDSIGDVLELNEATLNRLGLTKYNTEGFISIGTFVSNTLLTQDVYYGFDEDEAFLDVLAELQTKLVPETGVSLDKVGSKINWSWLYQPSDVDDRIAGYPTEDTDGYQLSGSLLLYGAKFEAGANDVTGMPTAAYGAYLDYFVSGESFNLPAAPTRPGYDFKGWKIGNAVLTAGAAYTVDEDDMVFTAQWEAKTDTPYKVKYYIEKLDGTYDYNDSYEGRGTTDTRIDATKVHNKSYENFTLDLNHPDTVQFGNIAGDGSLVLKLFYTRNAYDYTVRHIKQLPDGSYDEAHAEVETLSGKFEALAAVTAKDYGSHYPTNDADTKQNIKIEEGLTIDVKYDLDEHTLTFETNDGSAINPVTVRHGNAVARPADPTKDKYTFIGWYADPEFTKEYDFATVLEADKTIYAKFELTSTPIGDIYVRYDVLHIKQLPDGTYDLANAEVEHLSAKKDTTVTAVIKDYRATHHVNVNRTLSKLTGTAIQPYMGVDGKPVYTILSVYYDLDFHTLTFDTMGGSKIAPETVRHGLTVAKPKDPVNGGYIFDGWYTDKTFRHRYDFSTPLTEDITIYAKWFLIVLPGVTVKKNTPKLNTSDHFAYVQGYPDGTVKPAGNITRAETAAILFRLMDEGSRKTYYSTKSGFRDVASGSWYNTYVATLNNAGVITDSSNGCFRPNEAITRAELAAMLANFTETTGAANYFNDVSAKYWAANAIAICAKLGWINGYPDGTFRPDKNVTRAELMAMINRATGRAPKSADAFLPGMKTWIDNTSDKWYYLDVQEATNSHSYTVKGSETWTALTSDPNWSLYE